MFVALVPESNQPGFIIELVEIVLINSRFLLFEFICIFRRSILFAFDDLLILRFTRMRFNVRNL